MHRIFAYLLTASLFDVYAGTSVWIDENALKNAILKNPNDVKSRLIYARFLMEQNETVKAEAILHQNAKIDAASKELQKEIRKRRADLNRIEKKQPIHKKASKKTSRLPASTDKKVREEGKSFDEKMRHAKQTYHANPSASNVEKVLYLYSTVGKEQEQIEFLREHCRKHPSDRSSKILLARFLSWSGENKEALETLYAIDKKKSIEVRLLIGQILVQQGEYKQAKGYLADVARSGTKKQKFSADKSRAFMLRWEGDFNQSQALFLKLHQQNPADEEIAEEVLIGQKEFAPLITAYEKKLLKEPENTIYLEKISYLYQLDGQDEQALKSLEKLYSKTKKPLYLRSMGDIALNTKQTERGLAYWEQYAIKTDTPEGWLDYGKNLYWAGKYEPAQSVIAKVTDDTTVGKEAKVLISEIDRYLKEKERINALAAAPVQHEIQDNNISVMVQEAREAVSKTKNVAMAIDESRLKDNAGLTVNYLKARGKYQSFNNIDYTAEIGHYRFSNSTDSLEGLNGFLSVGNDELEIGAYIDSVVHRTSILPYLRLSHTWNEHNLNFFASQRNVGFIKYALAPLRQNNILTSFQMTDYAKFANDHELWASIDIAEDRYHNRIVTPQFNYTYFTQEDSSYTWSASVEGWYLANTRPSEDYYSPKKADANYLSANVKVPLTDYVTLDVMGGAGYSVESNVYLYKGGIWLSHPLQDKFHFRIGCSDYRSQSTNTGNAPYAYNVCDANLNYQW